MIQEASGLERSKDVRTLGKKGVGFHPYPMDRIGCWNSRGLNRVDKQHEMQFFLHNKKISLFGLLERKAKRAKATKAALTLSKDWSLVTNYGCHPGGRIWVIWKPSIMMLMLV